MRATWCVFIAALMGASPADAQVRTLAGRVSDAVTGEPLGAGEVLVKETGTRDRLRPDGVFVVRAPREAVTLVVRSVGYRSRSVPVAVHEDVMFVQLVPDPLKLDAANVEHRSAPGVSGDAVSAVPASSVKEVLQGRVAGADVQRNSGAPGGDLQVRLRGISSILGSTTPLYVVDGVVVSDASVGSGVSAVTGGADPLPGRLADLNLLDIAQIDVLKGVAATTTYGPRAANGVIVITTKRGRGSRP